MIPSESLNSRLETCHPSNSNFKEGCETLTSVSALTSQPTKGEILMAQQKFRVSNAVGMWLRTEPIVSEATKKVLLPKGQFVTKLGETDKPDWWQVRTTLATC